MMDTKGNRVTTAPGNVKYDEKVLKRIVTEAIETIPGVLGPHEGPISGLTDAMKHMEDVGLERGIKAKVKDNVIDVHIKMIAESGSNMPDIVNQVTLAVRRAMKQEAGLEAGEIKVDITDMMSRSEYESKFRTPKED